MKTVMIAQSDYRTDARVRREAETLAGAGWDVTVVGLGDDFTTAEGITVIGLGEVRGIADVRPSLRNPLYRLGRWLLLPRHRAIARRRFTDRVMELHRSRQIDATVVHAHDYPTLSPAATIARDLGARLVYDAHELWSATNRSGRPEPIRRRLERSSEGKLSREADLVITVSEGAAAHLAEWHELDNVHVIRNSFPVAPLSDPATFSRNAVYAGRVAPGRDLHTVLTAFQHVGDVTLDIVGPVDAHFAAKHHLDATRLLDPAELTALLARSAVALVTLEPGPLNHAVALPNKLFHAVSAGTPVVATDLPELRRVVEEHDIGALYTAGDPTSLRDAVLGVIADNERLRKNVVAAQKDLSWTTDGARLASLYEKLAS